MTTKTNPAASFRDQLLAEEPKLDAALKSFCSWIVASSSTASATDQSAATAATQQPQQGHEAVVWTLQEALPCTRLLSKAINAHIVPIHYDSNTTPIATTPEQLMQEVAAQVWNEVAAQHGTKITKVLGRTSLQRVWKDLDLTALQTTTTRHGPTFVAAFEQLLWDNDDTNNCLTSSLSNAALIWGGPHIMAQRAQQRHANATQRLQQQHAEEQLRQAVTPVIEELPQNDQDEDDDKPAATE